MHIYLVQHGEALSKEIDPARGLSQKGIEDVKGIANHAAGLEINVQAIHHSGKMRARETAGLFAAALGIKDNVNESDGLLPMDDPQIWYTKIQDLSMDVMLCGHLPHMGKLSSLMLCGDEHGNAVSFAMGCILCLKKNDDATWSVDWLIKPRIMA